jgi:multidrug efflux pump
MVIVGGMSLGTLLTLFVVPTVYTLFARRRSGAADAPGGADAPLGKAPADGAARAGPAPAAPQAPAAARIAPGGADAG